MMDFHNLPASQSACTLQEGTFDRLVRAWPQGLAQLHTEGIEADGS